MIALMLLGAVGLYVVMGAFIVKRIPKKWGKGIAIAILILIPTGDSIVGHLYFSYLCSSQAGLNVYQTVELPPEYWDQNRKPKFYDETNGNMHLSLDNYRFNAKTEKYPFHVDKYIVDMKEKSTGRLFNERTSFMYWGGWVSRILPLQNTATSCGSDLKAYTDYVNHAFAPTHSAQ